MKHIFIHLYILYNFIHFYGSIAVAKFTRSLENISPLFSQSPTSW